MSSITQLTHDNLEFFEKRVRHRYIDKTTREPFGIIPSMQKMVLVFLRIFIALRCAFSCRLDLFNPLKKESFIEEIEQPQLCMTLNEAQVMRH